MGSAAPHRYARACHATDTAYRSGTAGRRSPTRCRHRRCLRLCSSAAGQFAGHQSHAHARSYRFPPRLATLAHQVFNTSGGVLGTARWVRLPCTPATLSLGGFHYGFVPPRGAGSSVRGGSLRGSKGPVSSHENTRLGTSGHASDATRCGTLQGCAAFHMRRILDRIRLAFSRSSQRLPADARGLGLFAF